MRFLFKIGKASKVSLILSFSISILFAGQILFIHYNPNKAAQTFGEFGFFENFSVLVSLLTMKNLFLKGMKYPRGEHVCLFLLLFLYIGEEVSWGYHFLSPYFDYSPFISYLNAQNEPTVHNLTLHGWDLENFFYFSFLALLIFLYLKGSSLISKKHFSILISLIIAVYIGTNYQGQNGYLSLAANYFDELVECFIALVIGDAVKNAPKASYCHQT